MVRQWPLYERRNVDLLRRLRDFDYSGGLIHSMLPRNTSVGSIKLADEDENGLWIPGTSGLTWFGVVQPAAHHTLPLSQARFARNACSLLVAHDRKKQISPKS